MTFRLRTAPIDGEWRIQSLDRNIQIAAGMSEHLGATHFVCLNSNGLPSRFSPTHFAHSPD